VRLLPLQMVDVAEAIEIAAGVAAVTAADAAAVIETVAAEVAEIETEVVATTEAEIAPVLVAGIALSDSSPRLSLRLLERKLRPSALLRCRTHSQSVTVEATTKTSTQDFAQGDNL